MPWTPKDAGEHTKKATTARLKVLWAKTANAALRRYGDDGLAVRAANAAVARAMYER